MLLTAVVAAAVFAGAAGADRSKIAFVPADQAAARAAVIKRADLGTAAAWTGGATKPDLSDSTRCRGYAPKHADLVVTGAAASQFTSADSTLTFLSDTDVLRTPQMVKLDWQRSVEHPGLLPCLRETFAKELGAQAKLVSVRRVAFPRLARFTRAYRAVADYSAAGRTVRVLIDFVLIGRGRTEITLVTSAAFAARAPVRAAEVRLARLLVGRIRA